MSAERALHFNNLHREATARAEEFRVEAKLHDRDDRRWILLSAAAFAATVLAACLRDIVELETKEKPDA